MYGADRVLLELIAGLKVAGYAIQVVLPGPGPLKAEIEKLGVTVHEKNLGVLRRKYMSPMGLLNRTRRIIASVRFLRTLIDEHRIQIVHSNTTAVFSGVIAARLSGVKHVWHVHEITTRPLWLARMVAFAVGRLTHKAVFVSQASLEHMCRLSPRVRDRAELIHNGIDYARVLDGQRGVIRSENGWSDANLVVGMVGRISWWKGQGKLVECAAALRASHPHLRFLIVGGAFEGDVSSRQAVLESIDKADLHSVVAISDFRSDVGNVFFDIDLFVLPSTEPDPFPTVVLEAMAAGKPVIAFRHGGVCELVEEKVTGILCTPCSTDEMKAAIARLADDPALAHEMGLAGRERLDRLFSRQAYITRFKAVYRSLVLD